MKRLVETAEDGIESFLGETITVWCSVYIYTGTLVGVNDQYIKLSGASVVYETGPFDTPNWKDAQSLPHDWYVQIASIESWGKLK